MKLLTLLLTALSVFAAPSFAADEKHTFSGDVTGVVCAACKAHISTALMEKLPGVEKVEIERGDKLGVNKITIVSKHADVTKDTAMSALGDLAKSYQIISLAKK
jgi:copper chaperone CopZ